MSAKDPLHRLAINSPCSQDWEAMIGNDQFRFCDHCSLHVHNISQMTRARALRLVETSKDRICVRYYRDPNGTVATRSVPPRLYQLGRRVSRVAAGAFSATLSLSAATAQQPSAQQPGPIPVIQSNAGWRLGAAVTGTITDQAGGVIPGATVSLIGAGTAFFTTTSDMGAFRVEGLDSGSYKVRVEASGFNPATSDIYLGPDSDMRIDQTLEVAHIEALIEALPEDGRRNVVLSGAVMIATPTHPFVKAAFENNLEELSTLIAGIDVNVRDETTGTTALDQAVDNGNREMVELLLTRGANVNEKTDSGRTVLMRLDEDATSDLVWDLINAGADVDAKSETGDTPLTAAAYRDNVEVLKALLEAGADVNSKNEDGQTALMIAAENGKLQNVRALVLAGGDLNHVDKEGKNALAWAIESEHPTIIRFLRSKGAVESVPRVVVEE